MIGLDAGRRRGASGAPGVALGQEIRSGDVLYRYGPTPFVVLLPEQGLDTANLAADRLRRAAEHAAHGRAKVSVGIVTTGDRAGAGGAAGGGRGGAGAGGRVGRDRRRGRARRPARCGCWSPTTTRCRG